MRDIAQRAFLREPALGAREGRGRAFIARERFGGTREALVNMYRLDVSRNSISLVQCSVMSSSTGLGTTVLLRNILEDFHGSVFVRTC